jgi:hypothetical protein
MVTSKYPSGIRCLHPRRLCGKVELSCLWLHELYRHLHCSILWQLKLGAWNWFKNVHYLFSFSPHNHIMAWFSLLLMGLAQWPLDQSRTLQWYSRLQLVVHHRASSLVGSRQIVMLTKLILWNSDANCIHFLFKVMLTEFLKLLLVMLDSCHYQKLTNI